MVAVKKRKSARRRSQGADETSPKVQSKAQRRDGAGRANAAEGVREDKPSLALDDLVPGFLAYGTGRGSRAESVWLESERSDKPYQVSLPAEVLREYDEGDRLLVRITSLGDKGRGSALPRGRVESLIALHDDPDRAAKGLLRAYGITTKWPKKIDREIAGLSQPDVQGADAQSSRSDFRELPLVTIDGESARDFDDAVYCSALESQGWRLLVAIADVSHYVQPGSALDGEARRRSTSVYLPRQVVPMLPKILSNGLCSLVPGKDRLALAVDMKISGDGEILDFEFCQASIRSAERLTYTRVAALLDGARDDKLAAPVKASLRDLYNCYRALGRARKARGALDFETTEAELLFEGGLVSKVRASSRNDAHRLIEESMIAANVCAATLLDEAGLCLLFRVHPPPAGEKLEGLLQTLNLLGANLQEIDLHELSRVVANLSEKVSPNFLTGVVLRSMQQAVYSPDNQGHFGLSLERYAHFTSPIRRYPDLLVHRAIKTRLGVAQEAELRYPKLQELGVHCSFKEREAESLERDLRSWYLADYAARHIGDSFEGTISGVTSFGLFVLLDGLLVEGLLHISGLGRDWYEFDSVAHGLVGEATGKKYALGDKIDVTIAGVDVDRRKVDFVLREQETRRQRRSGQRAPRHATKRRD